MRIAVITDNNFFIDFGDTVVMVNKRKFCSFLESSWVSKFPDLYTTFSTNEVNFFKMIRANQCIIGRAETLTPNIGSPNFSSLLFFWKPNKYTNLLVDI